MTARLLSGKEFAAKFKEDAAKRARAIEAAHGVTPGLAVIIVGEDPASQVYVRNKDRACAELGIYSEVIRMEASTTKAELIAKIDELNYDKRIHGVLVQLPLPEALHREEQEILDRIDPAKDVDGFHPVNVGRLSLGQPALVPCTPSGCLKMLELAGIPLDGQRAVIVGRSNIVGLPVAPRGRRYPARAGRRRAADGSYVDGKGGDCGRVATEILKPPQWGRCRANARRRG